MDYLSVRSGVGLGIIWSEGERRRNGEPSYKKKIIIIMEIYFVCILPVWQISDLEFSSFNFHFAIATAN